jgi:acetyl-CoA C-acetyltransferase
LNKRNACIIATGVSVFGERQAHLVDLFQEAAKRCLDDIPGLKPKDIDGLFVATSLG